MSKTHFLFLKDVTQVRSSWSWSTIVNIEHKIEARKVYCLHDSSVTFIELVPWIETGRTERKLMILNEFIILHTSVVHK